MMSLNVVLNDDDDDDADDAATRLLCYIVKVYINV